MKNKKLVSVSLLKKKLIILKKNKKKIAFTNGCFDILHSGHIKLLLNSKKKSDILIVAVNSDKSYLNIKKRRPRFKFKNRVEILSQIKSIDYIIKQNSNDPSKLIDIIRPNLHCKGDDYKKKMLIEYELLKKLKIKAYIMPIKGKKISSSKINL